MENSFGRNGMRVGVKAIQTSNRMPAQRRHQMCALDFIFSHLIGMISQRKIYN